MARTATANAAPKTGPAEPTATPRPQSRASLVRTFAAKLGLGVDENRLIATLKDTAFKQPWKDNKPGPEITDSQMMALLVVANEYKLNPFLKEIYAFPTKGGGIVPMVGYDGWIRLVQSQPSYNGEELVSGYDNNPGKDGQPMGFYYDGIMWRRDRDRPTKVREYYHENYRNTEPWNNMPNRMTRNRAYIQCARMAFGFGGIYDPDEGERIANAMAIDGVATPVTPKAAAEPPRAVTQDEGPVLIAPEQITAVREAIERGNLSENDLLNQYRLAALEELQFDSVPEVMGWINQHSK